MATVAMSAPSARMSPEVSERAVELMRETAIAVAKDLTRHAAR